MASTTTSTPASSSSSMSSSSSSTAPRLTLLSAWSCWGGQVLKYEHRSTTLTSSQGKGLDARISVFLPPSVSSVRQQQQHRQGGRGGEGGGRGGHGDGSKPSASVSTASPPISRIPAIFFLSGLTSNEDNFITKSGAPQWAAQHGIALVCPDTSPRGAGCKDETESWDFGVGASYYVDATTEPYSHSYRMYSYIVDELYKLVTSELPIDPARISIAGHSVGGHGALVIGLRNPDKFRCISAFAPMSNPMNCPWGEKAFTRFLGPDRSLWESYDASVLMGRYKERPLDVLVDQGADDEFLEKDLKTQVLVEAGCNNPKVALSYHLRACYDHSYFYIATFIGEHVAWHAERLSQY